MKVDFNELNCHICTVKSFYSMKLYVGTSYSRRFFLLKSFKDRSPMTAYDRKKTENRQVTRYHTRQYYDLLL